MLAFAAAVFLAATVAPLAAQEPLEPVVVVDGLEFPSGLAFLADGSLVVNERGGVVNLVREGQIEKIAEIPTTTDGETGLLGAAVNSDDPEAIFVFATESDGGSNSIWRVDPEGGQPQRVIEDLPAAVYHNGGGVAFGDDRMLYVSNGEQHDDGRAQDPQALGGKVYRFTPTGEVPDDNPFSGSPAFAIGLRNPFGLAIDPLSGAPWVTENGPSSYDEVNRIVAGANLGWPDISGPAADGQASGLQDYQDPVLAYEDIIVPTGIAFAGSTGGGVSEGDLFFASYAEGAIHHVTLDESRSEALSDEILLDAGEPLIALAWGPGGLYFSTTSAVKMLPLGAPGEPDITDSVTPLDASGRGSPPADDGPPTALFLSAALALLALVLVAVLLLRRGSDSG